MPATRLRIPTLIALLALTLALTTACATDQTTLSLDEILEKTRAALSEVTSYKTRGTMISKTSSDDPSEVGTGNISTAWKSPDRLRMTTESTDYDTGKPVRNENLTIGNQQFFYIERSSSKGEWQEMAPLDTSDRVSPAEKPLLSLLDFENIELLSADKILKDGSHVIELKINTSPDTPESPVSGVIEQSVHQTILIDPETFLFIRQTAVIVFEFEDIGNINGVQYTEPKRNDIQLTYEFYDYNQPVTIEAPENYIPWQASSIVWDPRLAQPEHTPTPTSKYGCYESETAWPGCGLRTEDEVRAMLDLFPPEALIVVDENTVVTLATKAIPNINWPADAFIWHIPTASVAMACYTHESKDGETTKPPQPLRLYGTSISTLSFVGREHLALVLQNEALMAQILNKADSIEVDCSFIN